MTDELERMVRELHDKQAIRERINAYCRGIDRLDRALLLSVYHPDAIDDHGLFVGGPEAFADWAFALHGQFHATHQHIVTNHSCELDGDIAHTETYWLFACINREGGTLNIGGGRYIDRFEKRDGQWKIAARRCVREWSGVPGEVWLSEAARAAMEKGGGVARDRSDCSYERPLAIDPARVGYVFQG